jgi:hypothetical protein
MKGRAIVSLTFAGTGVEFNAVAGDGAMVPVVEFVPEVVETVPVDEIPVASEWEDGGVDAFPLQPASRSRATAQPTLTFMRTSPVWAMA